MLTRFAAFMGVAGLIFIGLVWLMLRSTAPDQSPFFLVYTDFRPGTTVDSVEDHLIRSENLRRGAPVWERCEPLDSGARRCERRTADPWGELQGLLRVVVASDGRVPYLSFAPETPDIALDDSLSNLQGRWARLRHVSMKAYGISEENPKGLTEFRSGRWRILMTYDGKLCVGRTKRRPGSPRPCPALIQVLDWRAARKYADMSVPR